MLETMDEVLRQRNQQRVDLLNRATMSKSQRHEFKVHHIQNHIFGAARSIVLSSGESVDANEHGITRVYSAVRECCHAWR